MKEPGADVGGAWHTHPPNCFILYLKVAILLPSGHYFYFCILSQFVQFVICCYLEVTGHRLTAVTCDHKITTENK